MPYIPPDLVEGLIEAAFLEDALEAPKRARDLARRSKQLGEEDGAEGLQQLGSRLPQGIQLMGELIVPADDRVQPGSGGAEEILVDRLTLGDAVEHLQQRAVAIPGALG